MVDNIELGTLTSGGWDTSAAPVASTANIWQAATAPTVNSDSTIGVRPGDQWLETNGNIWTCYDNTAGAAKWRFNPRTYQSGAQAAHTGNTNETKVASVAIAAGAMGTNGRLDIWSEWSSNTSGNNKTLGVKFGAANDLTGTAYCAVVSNSQAGHSLHNVIQNKNAANAQRGALIAANATSIGSVAGASPTSAIDTTAISYVVFALTLANGSDTPALESYRILLTRPDIT